MLRRMEHMTWLEVQAAAKETDTVLIPIGAVEQQGPHLPLGADTIAAQYIGEKVAERTGALLAPAISVGYSQWFQNFPGMLSINKATLTEVVRQTCRCLAASGFKRQLFINPHLGNDDVIFEVAVELRQEGIQIASVNPWHATNDIVAMGADIGLKEKKFTHAGEIMTSIFMAIAPELVKMDAAVAEAPTTAIPGGSSLGMHKLTFNKMTFAAFRYSDEETNSGSYGDPFAATTEKGWHFANTWVDIISEFVEAFRKA